LEQSTRFTPEDIVPVPYHPDGLAMAYAVKHEGEVAALTGLFGREAIMEGGPNTILFEKFPEV
jgi:hypothetical protein